ncbi:MAG: DUF539 domain-containing protein [Myxococcales bacterium]|nr:DUF539 domain-containing protein [Myxococcales bacterium]|tara:strand:- start:157 stop:366 length:210 start_codon:yes stop_codon:yes gene_type:complete
MIKMMLLTIAAFGLLMLAMAVGVMFGGKALKGSCGGVDTDCACENSGKPVCELKKKMRENARNNSDFIG